MCRRLRAIPRGRDRLVAGLCAADLRRLDLGCKWRLVQVDITAPSVRCLRFDTELAGQGAPVSCRCTGRARSARRVGQAAAQARRGASDKADKDPRSGGLLSPPLVAACLNGHNQCARLLLRGEGECRPAGGSTGRLRYRLRARCRVDCVALLLERGARISERSNGRTALEYVRRVRECDSQDALRLRCVSVVEDVALTSQEIADKLQTASHRCEKLLTEATARAEAKAAEAMAALLADEETPKNGVSKKAKKKAKNKGRRQRRRASPPPAEAEPAPAPAPALPRS